MRTASTQYSETFLAREIFGPLWGSIVLAAVASSEHISLPFDQQLRVYVEETNAGAWEATCEQIERVTCIAPEIIKMLRDEAPWLADRREIYDSDGLNAELALAMPETGFVEYDYQMQGAREAALRGARRLLIKVLEAILTARFCFAPHKEDLDMEKSLLNVLSALCPLLGAVVTSSEPSAVTQSLLQEWREKRLTELLRTAEPNFRDWLRSTFMGSESRS